MCIRDRASGVTLEEAKKYANADGSELNMVFQFEHTGGGPEADNHYGKWDSHKTVSYTHLISLVCFMTQHI